MVQRSSLARRIDELHLCRGRLFDAQVRLDGATWPEPDIVAVEHPNNFRHFVLARGSHVFESFGRRDGGEPTTLVLAL